MLTLKARQNLAFRKDEQDFLTMKKFLTLLQVVRRHNSGLKN